MQPEIAYILRSYPRLSQTFVLHEIHALERFGLRLRIFAVVNPHEPLAQAEVARVQAPVHYLAPSHGHGSLATIRDHIALCLKSPRRYSTTLWYVLRHAEIDRGYRAASRFECFSQAVYLLRLISDAERQTSCKIGHLHAHFAHDPALIAMLTFMLGGPPYSFTVHARDLYQVRSEAVAARVARATAVVACCAANVEVLRRIAPMEPPAKFRLVPYGVDLRRFFPAEAREPAAEVPTIVSVGRFVEKKGFQDLIPALGALKRRGYRFRCAIYGEGEYRSVLEGAIEGHDLAADVALAGAVTQQQLIPLLQRADVFVLTPCIVADGDRDGMPNVLLEAMACGLPVVSTPIVGIPEVIDHGRNGLLAAPRDVQGIADALAALLDDAALRRRLGAEARRTVVERYDLDSTAGRLAALLEGLLEGGHGR